MATGTLYQCSGCSVVFAHPKAWREGGSDEAAASGPAPVRPLTPVDPARPVPRPGCRT